MGDYPWDDMVEVGRTTVPLACNWKLYIENHIDWLHLWYLHQDSLKQYEHHEATLRHDRAALVLGRDAAGRRSRLRAGRRRARSPASPTTSVNTLRANLFFPNVPVACMGSIVQTYAVIPTGPGVLLTSTSAATARRARSSPTQTRAEGLIVLRDEDGVACEQMQVAMHSPRFEVGPLAIDHERPDRGLPPQPARVPRRLS